MWDSDENHLSPHVHPLKAKVKKPKIKDAKADSVEKIKVDQLLLELENTFLGIKDQPYASLFTLYQNKFLNRSVAKEPIKSKSLALAEDETPAVTSHRERKHRICGCASKGITDCKCDRFFSQPDCDIGWDSSRDSWYHGYNLYMLVASDSESDLSIFPLLNPAAKHDSHRFLHDFFRMNDFLPDFNVTKLLLDSAHDAIPYYEYCRHANITPFIDLNGKGSVKLPYKNDFTIVKDRVPVYKEGRQMYHDGSEPAKHRMKFRCPLASRIYGCSCEPSCSESKYGRTVHASMKDNPRLFTNPPHGSDEWKLEYNARV